MEINRRIKIISYWLLGKRHDIALRDLVKYLLKPRVNIVASAFIKDIEYSEEYVIVSFNGITHKLYWPIRFDLQGLYQVCSEIFDCNDWHNYEPECTRVGKEDIVIDVGAAEGLFSLSVLDRCRKIYIVEPNQLFKGALERTFDGYAPHRVEIFNVAAGDRNSQVSIVENSISSTIMEKPGAEVEMLTLDSLVTGKGKIDYIKADIEGFELDMLRGAQHIIQNYKPKMAITCYHGNNDYREMIAFVQKLVPEYKFRIKGLTQFAGKPVMVHFYI